jgi:SPP1 gp7 family putative phage head morphogenesis protein
MATILKTPVPHAEAAAFIRSKPAVGRSVFDRLLPEIKGRAFTITGIQCADTLQRARDLIAALPEGADWDTQKGRLISEISPYLVDSNADPEAREKQVAAASRRAEILMRLHGFQAYATAQHEVMERQRDAFPFWMYQTFGDGRVRPSHTALDGIILPADHPFWADHSPPWEWGCRCNKVPVTAEEAEAAAGAKANSAAGWAPGPAVVKRMEQTGMLDRGDGKPVDVRSPKQRAIESGEDPAAKYSWNPADMRLPLDELAKRYDATTWAAFRKWAEAQTIKTNDGEMPVWSWLSGTKILPPTAPVVIPPVPPPPPPATVIPPAPAGKGTPVSGALIVGPKGAHGKDIKEALIALDAVHGDGKLPKITIDHRAGTSLGVYRSNYKGEAVGIGVKAASKGGTHVLMTTAHEAGHFLDHQAFSPGKFASETNAKFAAWRDAIDKSAALADLDNASVSGKSYWKSRRELWARSYSQFIATKSGDQRMLAELKAIREGHAPWRQWADDDFKPIAKAIEEILKGEGWM